MNTSINPLRMPAEWELQDGVLLTWPHDQTDWADILDDAEAVFINIACAIACYERVVIAAMHPEYVRTVLSKKTDMMHRISIIHVASDDTWSRDFGPITVVQENHPHLLDFVFNGWGNKFAAEKDNAVTGVLHSEGIFGNCPLQRVPLVLEGGSIESDGCGTLLTTETCLLNINRNPSLNREAIEAQLRSRLGVERILWLKNGHLAGDDTDAHIDTLARLCPDNTIAYVQCTEERDEHYASLHAMEEELKALRTTNGRPYHLVPLPLTPACYEADGHRLPATYANFLIINHAVLVPTYRVATDSKALDIIQSIFPHHDIIGIDCHTLIRQHGSLHCVTMQLPKGTLS